jgi:hypothetical protein
MVFKHQKEVLEEIIRNLIRCGLIKSNEVHAADILLPVRSNKSRPMMLSQIEGVTAHRNERLGFRKLLHAPTFYNSVGVYKYY